MPFAWRRALLSRSTGGFCGLWRSQLLPCRLARKLFAGLPPALSRSVVFRTRCAGVCNSHENWLNNLPRPASGTCGDAPALSCGVGGRRGIRLDATEVLAARRTSFLWLLSLDEQGK